MSSALSITASVNPPRAVYLDYPLGHTAGKPKDKVNQRRVMIDTLRALESVQEPGTVVHLPYQWATDDQWKDSVMRSAPGKQTADDRVQRFEIPQYQEPADLKAADITMKTTGCPTCVWLADE